MADLSKTRIVHSLLSNRIRIARFGKDPSLALDQIDATDQFLQALTSFMFNGKMPEIGQSAAITYGGGLEQFKLTLERIDPEVTA